MALPTASVLLGRIALTYKIITPEQLHEATRVQGRFDNRQKLGEILGQQIVIDKGIVSSATQRSTLLPEVRTCIEAGLPGFCNASWHAVVAPARTPKAIIVRLHRSRRSSI